MQFAHFIFVEGLKTFVLIFLALLAAKIAGVAGRRSWVKWALYLAIIVLTVLGASAVGKDAAAEIYNRAAESQTNILLAYTNALRAVRLRPGVLRYWQTLEELKVRSRQFQSALNDEPALLQLSHGKLSDADAVRFATCRYFLGDYEQALAESQRLIQRSPFMPVAYAVEGLSYTALKQYPPAEKAYLTLLGMVPTDVDAVTGLARAYYLEGDAGRAQSVLDATRHYAFSPAARKRFEELKALYAE